MAIPTDRYERVSSHLENIFPSLNAPGLALAIVTKHGEKRIFLRGNTNILSKDPVTEQTKFQIGSISKAFASICLLIFAERGQLQLEDPITKFLPWFSLRGTHAPIRTVDLMNHSAGIISCVDRSLSPLVEVMRLRDTVAVTAPGERFHYSNVGYKALGLVIEQLSGKRVDEAIEEEVLQPLGMTNAKAAFTNEDRATLATGHIPFYDDRPCPSGGKLAIAPWFENNCADGSIIATIEDISRYAQALLNEMNPVLQAESFSQLTQPRVATGDGTHGQQYGLGLFLDAPWGHHVIGHSGGMVGYSSDMLVDLDAEVGVVALTNGDVDASLVTRGALAAFVGAVLPDEWQPVKPPALESLIGTYYIADGGEASITEEFGEPVLTFGGKRSALIALGNGNFYAPDHSPYFSIQVNQDVEGSPVLAFGKHVLSRRRVLNPSPAQITPEIEGHFRSYNPWLSNFRILHRAGQPIMVNPNGDEEPLIKVSDLEYAVADVRSPERLLFADVHASRAQTVFFSGQEYNRVFTP